MPEKIQQHIPRCPLCNSERVARIGDTDGSRAGIFRCEECGADPVVIPDPPRPPPDDGPPKLLSPRFLAASRIMHVQFGRPIHDA